MDRARTRVKYSGRPRRGNYYRSRLAEELFNFHAPQLLADWVATSRALAIELGTHDHGPMGVHTMQALRERGIPFKEPLRSPLQVSDEGKIRIKLPQPRRWARLRIRLWN